MTPEGVRRRQGGMRKFVGVLLVQTVQLGCPHCGTVRPVRGLPETLTQHEYRQIPSVVTCAACGHRFVRPFVPGWQIDIAEPGERHAQGATRARGSESSPAGRGGPKRGETASGPWAPNLVGPWQPGRLRDEHGAEY